MKAAYVSYADYGGPLVHTVEFTRAFREFVPDLVVHTPFVDTPAEPKREFRETFFNRIFRPLPASFRQLKLEFHLLRKHLRDRRKRSFFRRLFLENEVEIVIIRCDVFVSGAIRGARDAGLPYILEMNGVPSRDNPDRVIRLFEKWALAGAAGVTAVTEPLREMLIEAGARPENLILVPNGVRPETFLEVSPDDVPESTRSEVEGAIVAGYIGTFAPYHDVATLLEGFRIAMTTVPTLKLLFIGAGFRDVTTIEAVEQSGLSEAVLFTGHVSHDQVPSYAALCDILVNPLRKLYESAFHGVPIKLLEYLAAGRPIISTDMPNLREVLGPAALMVPEGDPEEWARALTGLATDSTLRNQLGRSGPTHLVEMGFTWRDNARIVHSFSKMILDTTRESG